MTTVVEVSGEVDLAAVPLLSAAIRRAQRSGTDVIVDLDQVTFIDCAGLRALVVASAGTRGIRTSVTQGSRQVRKLAELTGFADMLRVIPSAVAVDAAAAA